MHASLGRCAMVDASIAAWCRVHQIEKCTAKGCIGKVNACTVWTVVDAEYESQFVERAVIERGIDIHAEPDYYWSLREFLDVVRDVIPVSRLIVDVPSCQR